MLRARSLPVHRFATRALATAFAPDVDAQFVIIGGGVIGLAIARELAVRKKDVLVLEGTDQLGSGTSSRNSQVIHAGIYYPPGTLKAVLCVKGRHMLYDYCTKHSIPHKKLGKLIVATEEDQSTKLLELFNTAKANGVHDMQRLTREEVTAMEPEVVCHSALLSPSTGIVDSHELMSVLQAEAELHGATIVCNAKVVGGELMHPDVKYLTVEDSSSTSATGSTTRIKCRTVINAAGLHAQDVARRLFGDNLKPALQKSIPPLFLAKGNYFTLDTTKRLTGLRHLCYPIPQAGGLGIHATVDLGGGLLFGPDVEWYPAGTHPDEIDYHVDPKAAERFQAAVKSYLPSLPTGSLVPAYAGVRPKVNGPTDPPGDFIISGPPSHGVPGVIHMYGIESPGLTCALALAQHLVSGYCCQDNGQHQSQ